MANVIDRVACPKCQESGQDTAGDNRLLYDDGGYWCYACNEGKGGRGMYKEIRSRGLSKKTCEKMGISCEHYTGKLGKVSVDNHKCVSFEMYKNGKKVCTKIRCVKDSGKTIQKGDTKCKSLFGQHAFSPKNSRFLTITEGEFDAASIYEATGYAAVSVTRGAGGAKKQLLENLDWLQKFPYVVLCLDNDEIGQAATEECINIFDSDKVRVAKLPLKDANEMLMAGRSAELKKALWDATSPEENDVISPLDVLDDILTLPQLGKPYVWPTLTNITYGLRAGDLITFAGGAGVGKTEVVKEVLLDAAFNQGVKFGLFSTEQIVEDTFRRLIGGMMNKPIHLPGTVGVDVKKIKKYATELNPYMFSVRFRGILTLQYICNKIKYMNKAKGVSLFVLDNLKGLEASMDNKITGVADAMAELKSLINELGCTLILISHLAKDKAMIANKDEAKSWRDGRRPLLENVYGSSAIEAWSDCVFGISRNANSFDIDVQKLTTIQCLKARLDGSKSGKEFYLTYDSDSGRLNETKGIM